METNHDHNNDKKSNEEPDFSKDSTLEFHNKQNLKDLNSEAFSSKSEDATPNEDEDVEYKNRSVLKTSVRDRLPRTDTGISPDQ